MIAETFPLTIRERIDRLVRMAFNPGFSKAFGPAFGPGGGGPADKTLVYDTFVDTDGVVLSSHTISPINALKTSWTLGKLGERPADFTVYSNKARLTYTTGFAGWAFFNTGLYNLDIVFSLTTGQTTGSGEAIGVVFRSANAAADDDNYLWFYKNKVGGGTWKVDDVLGGAPETFISVADTYAPNTTYLAHITFESDAFHADIDNGRITFDQDIHDGWGNDRQTTVGIKSYTSNTVTNYPTINSFRVSTL